MILNESDLTKYNIPSIEFNAVVGDKLKFIEGERDKIM
jgi:hypothetical protein